MSRLRSGAANEISLLEIAALRSHSEGWRRHPEEVRLACNDALFFPALLLRSGVGCSQ